MQKLKKKKFFAIFFIPFLVFSSTKSFAYSSDPEQFIYEIVNEAKRILDQPNLDKEIKSEKLSNLALATVDIKGIAYYSLGNYRKNLTSEELKEYINLFEKYFLKSFTSRLANYSDPKIEVLSSEVLNPKYTIVKTLLLATNTKPEIKINWRVYTKNPEKPLIRDLVVEGLSLAMTQKEEFSSIIASNDNDVSKLFLKLEEFINK